jgi:glutamate-1-semialdehyde 2,1-aminomutase
MESLSPLGPVYQAGTLSGNPIGMAAGIETLRLCRATGFYDQLQEKAARLSRGLREAAEWAGSAVQVGACGGMLGLAFSERPVRNFDDAKACDHPHFARFFHEMLERGVWLPPSGYEAMFLSSAHDDATIAFIIDAAKESLQRIAP